MVQPDVAVTVYAFRSFEPMVECPRFSGFKATLDAIMAMGAEPLLATAEAVSDDQLDGDGYYRRRATGWGALD